MEVKIIIFWVLIIACAIPGLVFGFKKFSGNKQSVAHFKHWGYPLWFMHFLGLTEIICSLMMFFNATRMYGIAIFAILVIGATYTHLKYDAKKEAVKPLLVGSLVMIIFLLTFWIR
ncbi:DoxX family protein [Mucilaginibacter xinganensis]|uniref:DoxX family protein n=1 Tax=Mucilaginibacter xinganensis TaxID=1234841 RepID=A0A223P0L7_9SPHI|nr:DoxX family protein [Mucilaginibacter xinganensis]ASU35381.1 hypothetical protein MuYL_3496 [Mucilaginibacter xinganensis]